MTECKSWILQKQGETALPYFIEGACTGRGPLQKFVVQGSIQGAHRVFSHGNIYYKLCIGADPPVLHLVSLTCLWRHNKRLVNCPGGGVYSID